MNSSSIIALRLLVDHMTSNFEICAQTRWIIDIDLQFSYLQTIWYLHVTNITHLISKFKQNTYFDKASLWNIAISNWDQYITQIYLYLFKCYTCFFLQNSTVSFFIVFGSSYLWFWRPRTRWTRISSRWYHHGNGPFGPKLVGRRDRHQKRFLSRNIRFSL